MCVSGLLKLKDVDCMNEKKIALKFVISYTKFIIEIFNLTWNYVGNRICLCMYCEICQVSRYVVVVVVVEIFIHGAVKATVTNAPQSQLNKWVFSSFLNWPTVVSDWRSEAGRLFQSLGPATWNFNVYVGVAARSWRRSEFYVVFCSLVRVQISPIL